MNSRTVAGVRKAMAVEKPKEHPLLFSAPMVRALLAWRKTMTRRIVTPTRMPKHKLGDILIVREALDNRESAQGLKYRADNAPVKNIPDGLTWAARVRPPIFMPTWACRIRLRITSLRDEPLQAITAADARAEGIEPNWQLDDIEGWSPEEHGWRNYCQHYPDGCECDPAFDPREAFHGLWNWVHGAGAWDLNPTVRVIGFERMPEPQR